MTLGQKQELFARLVPRLIDKAHELGFAVRGGEWFRPPEMAALYAERGLGIKNSNHGKKIAIDLSLLLAGSYLRKTEEYGELGEWWEKQHPLCRWGGRFRKRDGGHFSLEHRGVK